MSKEKVMRIIGIVSVAVAVSLGILYGMGYVGGSVDVNLTQKSRQAITESLDSVKQGLNNSLENMKVDTEAEAQKK